MPDDVTGAGAMHPTCPAGSAAIACQGLPVNHVLPPAASRPPSSCVDAHGRRRDLDHPACRIDPSDTGIRRADASVRTSPLRAFCSDVQKADHTAIRARWTTATADAVFRLRRHSPDDRRPCANAHPDNASAQGSCTGARNDDANRLNFRPHPVRPCMPFRSADDGSDRPDGEGLSQTHAGRSTEDRQGILGTCWNAMIPQAPMRPYPRDTAECCGDTVDQPNTATQPALSPHRSRMPVTIPIGMLRSHAEGLPPAHTAPPCGMSSAPVFHGHGMDVFRDRVSAARR